MSTFFTSRLRLETDFVSRVTWFHFCFAYLFYSLAGRRKKCRYGLKTSSSAVIHAFIFYTAYLIQCICRCVHWVRSRITRNLVSNPRYCTCVWETSQRKDQNQRQIKMLALLGFCPELAFMLWRRWRWLPSKRPLLQDGLSTFVSEKRLNILHRRLLDVFQPC